MAITYMMVLDDDVRMWCGDDDDDGDVGSDDDNDVGDVR